MPLDPNKFTIHQKVEDIDWVEQKVRAEIGKQLAHLKDDINDTKQLHEELQAELEMSHVDQILQDSLAIFQSKSYVEAFTQMWSAFVLALQIKLVDKWFDPGDLDGMFGKDTKSAVKAYQESVGLVDGSWNWDGAPGKITIAKLLEVNTETPEQKATRLVSQLPAISDVDATTAADAQIKIDEILALWVTLDPADQTIVDDLTAHINNLKIIDEINNWNFDNTNWLTTLDEPTAKALATLPNGWLYLNWLTTLDEPTAKALATLPNGSLYLNWLTTLNARQIESLSDFDRTIYLENFELDGESAKAIVIYWLDNIGDYDYAEVAHKYIEVDWSVAGLGSIKHKIENFTTEVHGIKIDVKEHKIWDVKLDINLDIFKLFERISAAKDLLTWDRKWYEINNSAWLWSGRTYADGIWFDDAWLFWGDDVIVIYPSMYDDLWITKGNYQSVVDAINQYAVAK